MSVKGTATSSSASLLSRPAPSLTSRLSATSISKSHLATVSSASTSSLPIASAPQETASSSHESGTKLLPGDWLNIGDQSFQSTSNVDGDGGEDEDDADGFTISSATEGTSNALDFLRGVSARSVSQHELPRSKGKQRETTDDASLETGELGSLEAEIERRYYVFTTAGKPVYVSPPKKLPEGVLDESQPRSGRRAASEEEEESATTQIGVMTALISIYTDEGGDRLREIVSGDGRMTFLQRPPLLFAAVTKGKRTEPSFVCKVHLDLLHNQLLGILSTGQLNAMFKRKASVDLRRLLEGTDPILESLIDRMQWDRSLLLGALQPCRLSIELRDNLCNLLDPNRLPEGRRPADLLYVVLLFGSDVVALLRPKRHSVHPVDMQLLINTVQGTQALRETGSESWLPLSLPKFAPQGFIHVYSSVLDTNAGSLTLCFVTGDRDAFPLLRQWREEFCTHITQKAFATRLETELSTSRYQAEQIGVTGLRHFIYKSRSHTQITSPTLDSAYPKGSKDLHRLLGLYDRAYQAIHGFGHLARSAKLQESVGPSLAPPPLKMHYLKTSHEAVLAWITQPFELYLTLSPWLPKAAVVTAANSVAKWVKKHENSLFLLSPPVF